MIYSGEKGASLFQKTFTTLNIETDCVRLLCVRGQSITLWAEAPIIPGLIESGRIEDPAGLGRIIEDLFRKTKAPKDRVFTTYIGFLAISRIITLPRLKDGKMREAILWAIRREMPVSPESIYISWQVLEKNRDGQKVFLLGTPKKLFEPFLKALLFAGIKPVTTTIKPLAVARMVDHSEAIVVDIEKETVSIVIQKRSIPEIIKTTLLPGDSVIEDTVKKTADDLLRMVNHYNSKHPESPIGSDVPVFLTGRGQNDSVISLLSEIFSRPVRLPELRHINCPDLPVMTYAANIGLCLMNIAPSNSSCIPHPVALNVQPDKL